MKHYLGFCSQRNDMFVPYELKNELPGPHKMKNQIPLAICNEEPSVLLWTIQGRIYAANKYHSFARVKSIVSHKLRISCQIILNRRQICLFWWKKMEVLGYNIQIIQLFNTLLWGIKNSKPYKWSK